MPTRNNNKPQKINMRATTSQYEIQVAKITSIVNIKHISEPKTIAILYMMFRNRVTKRCPN